jgi:SAM-dependent MidA family methyltransferase
LRKKIEFKQEKKHTNPIKMNIYKLKENLSLAKLKASEKVKLREIEEESTNHFVAFADEGTDSFDIKIILDPEGNIVENECDCTTNGWCEHKIALLQHISKSKNTTTKRTPKQKAPTEIETLVDSVSTLELNNWIKLYLKKNKDTFMDFKLQFSPQKTDFTAAEIESKVQETIGSVIGKRKNTIGSGK